VRIHPWIYEDIYCEKYYYFWAMKINRGINYTLVLAGAVLLFFASSFEFQEVGLALGFILIMAGLYRLSQRSTPLDESTNPKEDADV
jgi:hypothetical protein